MSKRFSGNDYAIDATQCFSFASTAIAVTATAADNVANQPVCNSGAVPTDVTNRARRDGSITVTDNGNTGGAGGPKRA